MVSVGTIVWLSSELMFFAALFAMYLTIRSVTGDANWPPEDVNLNLPFASINTTVLVLSSVTCQLGVFAAERGDVEDRHLHPGDDPEHDGDHPVEADGRVRLMRGV